MKARTELIFSKFLYCSETMPLLPGIVLALSWLTLPIFNIGAIEIKRVIILAPIIIYFMISMNDRVKNQVIIINKNNNRFLELQFFKTSTFR